MKESGINYRINEKFGIIPDDTGIPDNNTIYGYVPVYSGTEDNEYHNTINVRCGLKSAQRILLYRPLRIAYLGGSNSVMKKGWRPLTQNWFNKNFPNHGPHQEINATLGGVMTLVSSFFVEHTVTKQNPDLVFIEYTINDFIWASTADGGHLGHKTLPLDTIKASVEGMVRNIKRHNPNCDIVFVHFPGLQDIRHKEKIMGEIINVYEEIADHYSIPSITISKYLLNLLQHQSALFRRFELQASAGRDSRHIP